MYPNEKKKHFNMTLVLYMCELLILNDSNVSYLGEENMSSLFNGDKRIYLPKVQKCVGFNELWRQLLLQTLVLKKNNNY